MLAKNTASMGDGAFNIRSKVRRIGTFYISNRKVFNGVDKGTDSL